MERVVNRSELVSENELSSALTPEPQRSNTRYEFDYIEPGKPKEALATSDPEELDFVLFAPSNSHDHVSQRIARIRVDTPPPALGEPGFTVQSRHRSHYFTEPLTDKVQENINASAVSGKDVLARSSTSWPGCRYEWRVTHIPSTKRQCLILAASSASHAVIPGSDSALRRKRPGKKSRIKVRTTLAAAKTEQDERQKAAELKEVAEREKRTRRNREKKAKKKQREKAKKTENDHEADLPSTD